LLLLAGLLVAAASLPPPLYWQLPSTLPATSPATPSFGPESEALWRSACLLSGVLALCVACMVRRFALAIAALSVLCFAHLRALECSRGSLPVGQWPSRQISQPAPPRQPHAEQASSPSAAAPAPVAASAPVESAWIARPRPLSDTQEQCLESAANRRWIGERGWLRPGEQVHIDGEAVALRAVRGPTLHERTLPGIRLPWLGASPTTPAHEWLPDELVRIAPASGGDYWESGWTRIREQARLRLETIADPRTRALCIALLLGDTRELAEADEQRFMRSGIYHLLVVSGTQVALLSALFFLPLARWLLHRLRLPGRWRTDPVWLASVCVCLYVPLTGGCAPVLRAGLVWVLGSLAPRCEGARPRVDALSLWALALCVECLIDPLAPRSLSVQLSYGATLGLIAGTGPLLARWRERAGECGLEDVDELGRARPEWLVALSARAGRMLRAALASSLVATIVTLPILCAHFGEVASLGMLATVLCAPLAALLLLESALLALSGVALPAAAGAVLFQLPSDWIHALSAMFDALPGSPWCPPDRPVWLVVLWSSVSMLAIRSRGIAWLRVALLLGGGLLLPWSAAPVQGRSVALEVGHGTAVLHQGLDGRLLLFDGGTRDRTGLRKELALLIAEWEAELDTVVLSHRDSDHSNALPWLMERHPPRLYVGPRLAALDAARGSGLRCIDLEQAGVLELGTGRWLVRGAGTDDNEGSRSLLLESPQGWLLWCGDAEAGGLVSTLRLLRGCSGPFACVLLPHHGASTPHLGALLEQCRPAELWISAGMRMELTEELERRGVRWRWTERDGPLTLPR